MPKLPPYHISEQSAYALLQPVQASLRELETRTQHYLARLHLVGEQDRAALEAASRALAEAAHAIEQVVAGSAPAPR